ncbi:hypothetical protein [Streptomyces sp. AcE210]|uniref:hypothetical protein n=1 Tax=Streptomyces sp. AcE210 TaxID=2292703 RepID=UPI001404FF98|nr:hypothetical protein [Streptomyces sp. AcE210]
MDDDSGHLRAGMRADVAVWATPLRDGLPELVPSGELPHLVRTIASGRTVHDHGANA